MVGASARSGKGLRELMDAVARVARHEVVPKPAKITYIPPVEEAIAQLEPVLAPHLAGRLNARWVALKLLDGDAALIRGLTGFLGFDLLKKEGVADAVANACGSLVEQGFDGDMLRDRVVSGIVQKAEQVCADSVFFEK